MKFFVGFSSMFFMLILEGCSFGWTHPEKSEGQFNQDRYQCEQESASMYPVNMVSNGPGYSTPARTNCATYGNQTNCTTTPGTHTPAAQSDANAIKRSFAFESCLKAKGYVWKAGR